MLFVAALLLAQTAPQCAATDAALPAGLSGWRTSDEAGGPTLGKSVVMNVTGGSLHADFRIESPGTYGVALDQPGWIDVSPAGASAPMKSVKHSHAPDCSTIRKIVRFELQPGAYRLDLTNLKQAKVKVMLIRD